MPDQEKQTREDDAANESTIVIDGAVVRLLRTGAYASLGLAADDVSACTSPAGRETNPDVYTLPLERLDCARSLLNVLGWRQVDSERQIEVEGEQHRAALAEAAKIALDTSEDTEPASRPAAEHVQGLRELIEHLGGGHTRRLANSTVSVGVLVIEARRIW